MVSRLISHDPEQILSIRKVIIPVFDMKMKLPIKFAPLFLAIFLFAGLVTDTFAVDAPVAKLVGIQGEVEYSRKNGKKWSPVRRSKYLFPGYLVRTGDNGSVTVIDQVAQCSQSMGKNSIVKVSQDGILVIDGNLSEPEAEDTSIYQSIQNKFASAQRYTTVRRSVLGGEERLCDSKVRTIRKLTLSKTHSDLVWRNACPEFSYKLVIDGAEAIQVPAQSTAEMIRYNVKNMSPGEHTYRVEVLDRDGIVYIPRRDSSFTMLTDTEEAQVLLMLDEVEDDILLKVDILEDQGLFVAAMDTYRSFFKENPKENELRPLLIQSYQLLKLSNLGENEARLYNSILQEDL